MVGEAFVLQAEFGVGLGHLCHLTPCGGGFGFHLSERLHQVQLLLIYKLECAAQIATLFLHLLHPFGGALEFVLVFLALDGESCF